MRHFTFWIHCALTTRLALIFVGWMYVWTVCRVGPGRTVRTFVAIATIDLTQSCYWCLVQHGAVCNFTSCAILLSEYIATSLIIMALHWSSLVECMERVLCWPWTNSAYVCSYCCVVCDWPYYSKLLLVLNAVWFVCNFTSCPILLSEYTVH